MNTRARAFVVVSAICAALVLRQSATPSAQGDPANLLSYASGTIVRSYTRGLTSVHAIAEGGGGMDAGTKGPLVVVWELPGVATLSDLTVTLYDGAKGTFAVSTTSAADGFKDVGTAQGDKATIAVAGVKARWVRATVTLGGTDQPFGPVSAAGTLAPRPANAPAVTGEFWVFNANLNGDGGVLAGPVQDPAERVEINTIGNGINATQCSTSAFVEGYPGTLNGRVWTYKTEYGGNDISGKLIVNDEGTLIVGGDQDNAGMHAFGRMTKSAGPLPDYCKPVKHGSGASNALVLQTPHWDDNYPGDDAEDYKAFKNFTVAIAPASLLTPQLLNGMDLAVLNGLCRPDFVLSPSQGATLMQWVQAGHKLLITDSDMCGGEPVSYDFLPYKFKSDNPGAKGAEGHVLVVVENNSLGTKEKADATHFVDANAYLHNDPQQLGDANTVVTQDDHWCGHLFGVNANNANGYMEMYALYGKGLIIYNGFDVDDKVVPVYQKIRQLEYAAPVPPDLPCSRHVNTGFVIVSDDSRTFVPGTASTVTVPMQVLSNRDWKGHVTLAASGDFPATVSPAAVDLPPGTRDFTVTINIPATAKAGHYAVTVKGTSGSQTGQALVAFESKETSSTLKNTLDASCTAAIYGVNFDFNKTTIRPDADPVLQQLLALFKGDPALSAEIGGHTDNVGTAAYNLTLSAGRADAVKSWLVAHGIAASRLTTHGYGDTVPLVPNDSDANRAKNRRVELKKANCAK